MELGARLDGAQECSGFSSMRLSVKGQERCILRLLWRVCKIVMTESLAIGRFNLQPLRPPIPDLGMGGDN